MYFVYVIKNNQDRWYIGQTNNIKFRLERHNNNEIKSTKNRGPWKLFHSEKFETRSEAMRREEFLKSGRGRLFLKSLCSEKPLAPR
jgi:putative endonuclease